MGVDRKAAHCNHPELPIHEGDDDVVQRQQCAALPARPAGRGDPAVVYLLPAARILTAGRVCDASVTLDCSRR